MLSKELIYEYERTLLGTKKDLSLSIGASEFYKENITLEIMRYAIKNYLGWDVERAVACLEPKHLDLLKLTPLLVNISCPPEIDINTDFFYVVSKLYPGRVPIDLRELTINTYKKVLKGILPRFPKGFFDGAKGILRSSFCLQYAINQNFFFDSIEEGYAFFATSDANKFLREQKLYAPIQIIFDTPLDYYHESLGEKEKNEYYLNFYKFKKNINKVNVI